MKKVLMTLSVLSMSAAVSACGMMHNDPAHNPPPPPHCDWEHKQHMNMMADDLFRDMDANGDGVVSRKEYYAYMHAWFKEADTNHDGKLTLKEVKMQMKREKEKMKAAHMNHAPVTNADGTTTPPNNGAWENSDAPGVNDSEMDRDSNYNK